VCMRACVLKNGCGQVGGRLKMGVGVGGRVDVGWRCVRVRMWVSCSCGSPKRIHPQLECQLGGIDFKVQAVT
jgi:hypothetical protein